LEDFRLVDFRSTICSTNLKSAINQSKILQCKGFSVNFVQTLIIKIMKRIQLFAVLTGLFIGTLSFAQTGVGAQFGVFTPLGENSGDSQLGVNFMLRHAISDKLNVGANVGYFAKSQTIFGTKITGFSMPITATAEYVVVDGDLQVYGSFDLGLYRFGIRSSNNTNSSSEFGVAPGAGVRYGINDNLSLDVAVRYNIIFFENNSSSVLGTNVGLIYFF
jgi:opacity protein-like surface antigen